MPRLPQTESYGADGWNNSPEWVKRGLQLAGAAAIIVFGYLVLTQVF